MSAPAVAKELSQLIEDTKTQFSLSELRFFQAGLKHKGKWMTKKEWADASGIIVWTIQRILPRFVKMGLMDREEIAPSVFYCFTDKAAINAPDITHRYSRAIEILKSRE